MYIWNPFTYIHGSFKILPHAYLGSREVSPGRSSDSEGSETSVGTTVSWPIEL